MVKVAQTFYNYQLPISITNKTRTWHRDALGSRGSGPPYLSSVDKASGQRSDFISKDVLVVEDEAYLCELIGDVIESEGHTVRKASNGLEALDRMQERKPQLILLDLMMPIMDGWEFMEALRANPEWDGMPIVIITAIYDVKRTQEETGARAVITKPFDIDQIIEIVRLYAT